MKKLVFIIAVMFVQFSFGQQLYDYYNGYLKGFQKGCGCSNKPPNANKLYYHGGTQTDGYNDGYTDGRIFLNQNSQNQQEDNLYTPDFNLIQKALEQKQNLLDQRRAELDTRMLDVCSVVKSLTLKRALTQTEQKYLEDFVALYVKYKYYDLTYTTTYNQILTWLADQKSYFLTWK